jgi:hypothetical protein
VEVTSKSRLQADTWTHVAAVYDMHKLRVYVNGHEEGAVECPPSKHIQRYNTLTIGAPHPRSRVKPVPEPFEGRMRHIRMYERNLSPDELLLEP